MRVHTANELRDYAVILAPDGATVLASGVHCGIEDLQGRRLEQAQLSAPQTSHVILFRTEDAVLLTEEGYVTVNADGRLYQMDYLHDPRQPRTGMWLEAFCHAEGTAS